MTNEQGTAIYLGTLCRKGHDHENTGQSLRYLRSHLCMACSSERYRTNQIVRAQRKEASRRYYERNRVLLPPVVKKARKRVSRCDVSLKPYLGSPLFILWEAAHPRCEKWNNWFYFRAWALKSGYTDGDTVQRINPQGIYEPLNCSVAKRS